MQTIHHKKQGTYIISKVPIHARHIHMIRVHTQDKYGMCVGGIYIYICTLYTCCIFLYIYLYVKRESSTEASGFSNVWVVTETSTWISLASLSGLE